MRKARFLTLILLILTINSIVGFKLLYEQKPYFSSIQKTSLKQTSTSVTMGPETQVNSYETQYGQRKPSISSFSNTSFLISWYGYGWASNGDDIFVDHFNSTAYNYTDDVLVNTNLINTQQGAAVSSIPDGSGFVVAWHSYIPGTDYDIFLKIFDQTATNTTDDILVNGNRTSHQQFPSVCCFSDGSFVVTWTSYQDGLADVYVKKFNSTGYNETEDILVNTITTGVQIDSDICCQSDGSFVVTWRGNGLLDTNGVYAKIFNSTGHNKTGDILINSYTTSSQWYPSISKFSDDSFIISWEGTGIGDAAGIFTKIFNATGFNQTDDILVNAYTTNGQYRPSVSCFSDDSFVISWHGAGRGDDVGVYARKFNSTGYSQSDDIRVNAITINNQENPVVCCLANGTFVVSWESYQNDNWDVFFRVITNSSPEDEGPMDLISLLFLQPSTGINQILVIAGILVAVVLIVVIIYLIKRR